MNSQRHLAIAAIGSILSLMACDCVAAQQRPNIVVILADDLGNADLGYRGSEIKTPNIDQLAKGGVRLESFHGMPVCTPARAALMTGRYPMRYGLQTLVIFPNHTYGLPTDERTLPQALKEAGYSTAMVGKWHLGHADKKFWPQNRGFDHFYGNTVGEVDYFTHKRAGIIDWQRNGSFIDEKGYVLTLDGDEAVKLIDKQPKDKPFFLYFASLAPHAPYQAQKADEDRYATTITDPTRRTYAAMITSLDDQVGRIVARLERRGMRDNTLIIFSSDNGGPRNAVVASGAHSKEERTESGVKEGSLPANNGVLRGGKGSLYEGGVRVPTIFNWPAKLKPGVVNEPLHMVDIMPTALALAGATANSADKPLDGKDIWATVANGTPSPHDDILVNVEAFRGAIIKGRWKLVKIALLPGKTELFDLTTDPGEKNNVADQNVDVVRDLETRLLAYAKQQKMSEWLKAQPNYLGAQGQTIFDPDFDIDDGGLPRDRIALPKHQ
ncbi:arylsulfatase B [Bradyrhizobium symbiodeficiens]|uniref:arylsulfatase B n=1 Tax=Bradyrhizobium symbiodeficiens TaxID=1404367 RepID=UPI000BA1B535|nr:arylsulfatase [Bradyrhizobium symbiodeficiens]AWM08889.1 sulfatase [Bradyrhizobium symbiodeficiens]